MQRIAVTVRLHRSTLQFDDAAYARLEQYLAESASLLEGDPDPQEILADLEQAVADQCTRRLRPGQTVVTLAELAPALDGDRYGAAAGRGGFLVRIAAADPVVVRRADVVAVVAAAGQPGRGDQRCVPGAGAVLPPGCNAAASHLACCCCSAPVARWCWSISP